MLLPVSYTHLDVYKRQGLKELKIEICKYLQRRCNVAYDYNTEVTVTVGGSEAIDIALRAMLDPGDEVLIPQPSYVSYVPCTVLAAVSYTHLDVYKRQRGHHLHRRDEGALSARRRAQHGRARQTGDHRPQSVRGAQRVRRSERGRDLFRELRGRGAEPGHYEPAL